MLEPRPILNPDPDLRLPRNLHQRLAKFLLDKSTGNVELNVKDGEILGWKLVEMHRPE